MIDIMSKDLVYTQVRKILKDKGIKQGHFFKEIGMTQIGFQRLWKNKNPKSIQTLIDIIKTLEKYDTE